MLLVKMTRRVPVLEKNQELTVSPTLLNFAAIHVRNQTDHQPLVRGEFRRSNFQPPAEMRRMLFSQPLFDRKFVEKRVVIRQCRGGQRDAR